MCDFNFFFPFIGHLFQLLRLFIEGPLCLLKDLYAKFLQTSGKKMQRNQQRKFMVKLQSLCKRILLLLEWLEVNESARVERPYVLTLELKIRSS